MQNAPLSPKENFDNLSKSLTHTPVPDSPYYKVLPNGTKEPITRSEYKQHQHDHVTVTHQVVQPCGHKFVPGAEPRHRNCESCWFAYFQVHGEITKAADEVFQEHGEAGLRQLATPKFVKYFLVFMGALAQWKALNEAAQAEEEAGASKEQEDVEESASGTGSDGGDESILAGTNAEEDGYTSL
jgi:predicted  nucleic acid-binding Zn-ribbon protein